MERGKKLALPLHQPNLAENIWLSLNDVFEAEGAIAGQPFVLASATQVLTMGAFRVHMAKSDWAGASSSLTTLEDQNESTKVGPFLPLLLGASKQVRGQNTWIVCRGLRHLIAERCLLSPFPNRVSMVFYPQFLGAHSKVISSPITNLRQVH